MQIEMTLRFHLTAIRMAKIKHSGDNKCCLRMWRKRKTHPLLVGLQICTTTLELNMEVPPIIENSST
jgi:predicted permease